MASHLPQNYERSPLRLSLSNASPIRAVPTSPNIFLSFTPGPTGPLAPGNESGVIVNSIATSTPEISVLHHYNITLNPFTPPQTPASSRPHTVFQSLNTSEAPLSRRVRRTQSIPTSSYNDENLPPVPISQPTPPLTPLSSKRSVRSSIRESAATLPTAKKPRTPELLLEEKLSQVLQVCAALGLSWVEVQYEMYRLPSGTEKENWGDTVHSKYKSRTATIAHFLQGRSNYSVSDILNVWIRHPYGRKHKQSPQMFSGVETAPYLSIRPVRPAMTSFAVQISVQELVSKAGKAIQPDAGLHIHIPSTKRPEKKNVAEVDWLNIGAFTQTAISEIHQRSQSLLCYVLKKVMTRRSSKSPNQSRSVDIVADDIISKMVFTRSPFARLPAITKDEEEGEDLCNCQFSLAYGAKILLNTATLRLKRGHRYGLCSKNGTRKSILMRAITNGQVEGFPSPDEVRTFYVEHDIDGSEEDTSVLQFILSDKRILATEADVIETLASVGFSDERQAQAIGSLSGGWKMKLALARAMLFRADILLLDEPTDHLDVVNIAWLESYLTNLKTCTSIIVSHDSSFLNNTITDVLHLNRFKLRRYRGNLEKFVAQVPEAKSYYTLEAAEDYKFKLPDPPLLEGVKTKEKSLLKIARPAQYPTQVTQQLYDITLQVSLSSRVAVLGPNGSGKPTLIKLLIGDMEPNKDGEIWKHPNLVIGYIAQHAFHHIDNHLDKTPLEYMLWRYQTGEDLEEMTKANRQISEEEAQKMKDGAAIVVEGQKRLIDEIVGRKKLKQSYEHEVSFKGLSSSENIWLPRDDLVKRGFEKKVIEVDTREAQRLGLLRPLVRREIEKHFADFGLEPEFVLHNTMRGLSGKQKVKIVLGAATWCRPHIMCLDEPTNYLDRESLAALIEALKVFEGGVLVITHNCDFSESLCKEVWAMRDGRLEASSHNWVEGQGSGPRIDKKDGEDDDQYDAMGNKIESKKAKKITSSEARKLKKERMARKKRGENVTDDEL
ncbi:uncharacterized protein ARMOST_15053 [Armillaria ostoyae]|uniref:ABC transporter domain-containing protein n=1 Tax=Armillaria ostoyae TaxID=47428 RepID=A0A284RSB3_ARMOS|nr:uncharacterized protein ARMOST_15053 [Armillaria ostoyae]